MTGRRQKQHLIEIAVSKTFARFAILRMRSLLSSTRPDSISDRLGVCPSPSRQDDGRAEDGRRSFYRQTLGKVDLLLQGLSGRHRAGLGIEAEEVPNLALISPLTNVPTVMLIPGEWE